MKNLLAAALLICSGELLGASLYSCVVDGQVTYTNQPCPGSKAASIPTPPPRKAESPPLAATLQPQPAAVKPASMAAPAPAKPQPKLESSQDENPMGISWWSWLVIPALALLRRWFSKIRRAFRNPSKT